MGSAVEKARRAWARVSFPTRLGLVAFAWFALLAVRLPLDEDEGYCAIAGELVAHGRLPYHDFFDPQMPLASFVLAPFVAAVPRFVFLRLVTAAFAAVATSLVVRLVLRESQSRIGAGLAAVLFASHELSWRWLVTLRPYAIGEICTLGALLVVTPRGRHPSAKELVLGGALAAAAPLARLPLAPTVGVIVLAVLLRGRSGPITRGLAVLIVMGFGASAVAHPIHYAVAASIAASVIAVWGPDALVATKRGLWLAVGIAAATLVVAGPFWLLAKDAMAFDVVRYHQETSKIVGWPQSRRLLFATLGGGAVAELSAIGTQNVMLVLANLVALTLASSGALRIARGRPRARDRRRATRACHRALHGADRTVPRHRRGRGGGPTRSRLARAPREPEARALCVDGRHLHDGDGRELPARLGAGHERRLRLQGATPVPLRSRRARDSSRRERASGTAPRALAGERARQRRAHAARLREPIRALGWRQARRRGSRALPPEEGTDLDAVVAARTPAVVVVDRQTGFGEKATAYEALLVASGYAKADEGTGFKVYVRLPDVR